MNIDNFTKIPEYPEYLISPLGEVWSTKSNRLLTIFTNTPGYNYFSIRVEGKTKNILLSRALARVYKNLPSLDSELEVDHDDRNKLNNDLDNLVVRTKLEHRIKTHKERDFRPPGSWICNMCGKKVSKSSDLCRSCYKQSLIKDSDITAEIIEYWVKKYSWVRAGKELGLSDNGVRKRYTILTGKDPKSIKGR